MSEYIFGAHILESLTTGMYQDSRMIFREYIQNACDSIDKAASSGLINRDDGEININIDPETRNITIRDNGTGIKSREFERVLGNIADSDKKAGIDKGFRGIGRLCGLAYCEKLIFTAKFQGEKVISKLVCNAKVMRELISEDTEKRYTASEVLNLINEFAFEDEYEENIDEHYFIVELVNINSENTDLLNYDRVKKYLSFTVPLPYYITFSPYRSKIYEYAKKSGSEICEYNIYLNNEQLFKPYTIKFTTGRGQGKVIDEIFDIRFIDFRDVNNNLIAWLWLGISHFKGAISEDCMMRGIRLRKENIQIGNEDTLQRFFSESRGQHYFIGELFCVSKDLIPNSQRDYFNENKLRVELENQLRNYFTELSRIYHAGSKLNKLITARDESMNSDIKPDEAAKINSDIEKLKTSHEIIRRVIADYDDRKSEHEEQLTSQTQTVIYARKYTYTQKEQKIIDKIFSVINSSLDSETAQELIIRIKDALEQ
ncbi:MAG: ATP-binding protein [Synergistaceae bacterium]|nr:ATP-binding protein [Synergistaceae bacterium]